MLLNDPPRFPRFWASPLLLLGCTRIVSARQQPRQKGKSWLRASEGFYFYLPLPRELLPRFWLARMKAWVFILICLCLGAQAKRSANICFPPPLVTSANESVPLLLLGSSRIVSARQQPRQKGFYSYLHANICFPRFWLARMKAWAKVHFANAKVKIRTKVHFVLIFSLQIRIKTNAKVKIRTKVAFYDSHCNSQKQRTWNIFFTFYSITISDKTTYYKLNTSKLWGPILLEVLVIVWNCLEVGEKNILPSYKNWCVYPSP